ncbi:hypothetical protein P7F88_06265 [Vibrio hannami]|uniref:hypothetical protein n=1 Tax=Vibrio hannami TaxID=2717094 RepID=UPI00241026A2|nr:hypothetical protein [Vibrio hannami]MDG3085725.1 hypothetical protein [Vibrio hannami]
MGRYLLMLMLAPLYSAYGGSSSVFLLDQSEINFDWDWTVSSEHSVHRETGYVQTHESRSTNSIDGLLDVEVRYKQWTGLFALSVGDLYNSGHARSESDFVIQELFTQGTVDVGGTSLDYLLGKTRLDWGIGYGHRPLDIFKPYRRNPVGIQVEEGSGVASISYFDMDGEWTLIYSDSSWNNQKSGELDQLNEQQGVGLRRYWLSANSEYQLIAYYDDVRRGLVGSSLVSVLDASWEIHASALFQQQYYAYSIPTNSFAPVSTEKYNDGVQALFGFTWANESGHQVIGEYWYDSRSWSRDEWKNANSRVDNLASSTAFDGLRYSYANGFNHANLVQHNLMIHWSLNGSSLSTMSESYRWIEDITPTFDLIFSPEDKGFIVTQWINYQVIDTGDSRWELEAAARFYSGDGDSVYANLPDRHKILMNVKGRF